MLNPITSIVVYLIEMLISYIFFSNISDKRVSSVKCLIMGCFLFVGGSLFNLLFKNNVIINLFATIIINGIFCWICFDNTVFLSLFYSFILTVINGAWEFAIISFISNFTDSLFFAYNNDFALFILECPLCKILYFSTLLILSKIVKPGKRVNALPVNLFLYPIATTICLCIFWYICSQFTTTSEMQQLLAVASLILLGSTVLLFITYQHQIEEDREAMRIKSEYARLQTEKSYYHILEQQNQQLMIYAHDAKNHLAAIKSLNTDPQISSYISKLSEQLAEYTHNCHSGNKLLDVMIHKYSVDCEMRGICFDYDVKLCNLSEVEDIDLVGILGNLIDNAISAAENSEQKRVSLATARRNSYSIIVITNSCDTPPKANGNHLITSKSDQKIHGFGLKSVGKTLKKYQGDFEWEYDDNFREFTVTVMVGDPNKSTSLRNSM